MLEVGRRRRPHCERLAPPVAQVDPLGVDATAPRPAELIRRALLGGRKLGHRRRDDVAQRPAVGRGRGEAPRGALVVHQPAGAVDGVDDDRPRRVIADHDGLVETFRHHLDALPVRLEPLQQRVVGDAVDGVDRVGDRSRPRSPPCPCPGHRPRCRGCGCRARTGVVERRQVSASRSSAAFSSGSDSLVIEPPPISGPARYFSSPGARSGGCSSTWNG